MGFNFCKFGEVVRAHLNFILTLATSCMRSKIEFCHMGSYGIYMSLFSFFTQLHSLWLQSPKGFPLGKSSSFFLNSFSLKLFCLFLTLLFKNPQGYFDNRFSECLHSDSVVFAAGF